MARPSARDLFKNFDDYHGSLDKKVTKGVANTLRKVVTVSDCCGNHGEPGC
jgi:hypothetical protein